MIIKEMTSNRNCFLKMQEIIAGNVNKEEKKKTNIEQNMLCLTIHISNNPTTTTTKNKSFE